MFPADFTPEWRAKAAELRQFGADEQAKTLEWCANRLEEALRQEDDALLTLHGPGNSPVIGKSSVTHSEVSRFTYITFR